MGTLIAVTAAIVVTFILTRLYYRDDGSRTDHAGRSDSAGSGEELGRKRKR